MVLDLKNFKNGFVVHKLLCNSKLREKNLKQNKSSPQAKSKMWVRNQKETDEKTKKH